MFFLNYARYLIISKNYVRHLIISKNYVRHLNIFQKWVLYWSIFYVFLVSMLGKITFDNKVGGWGDKLQFLVSCLKYVPQS